MKHNWEYRRLGVLCQMKSGSFISADELDDSYEFPCFGGNGIRGKINKCSHDGDLVIIGRVGALCGNVNQFYGKFYATEHAIVATPRTSFISRWLYYTLSNANLRRYAKGAAQPVISVGTLNNIEIPVPPMETQEQIVAELDQINDLIAKNRELLSQLDALAQSLFYDTFGDPLSNPKGWVARKFNDIIKLKSGNPLPAKNIVAGIFPVYGGNGIVGFHNESNLNGSNIIIGRVGALCGNVRLVKGEIFVTDNAFITEYNGNVNLLFLERLLTLLNLRQYANAAAQPVISNISLKNILVILPPLALQEDFAAKVEAIAAQKAKVEAVIAELQTLLDARMDYWFN